MKKILLISLLVLSRSIVFSANQKHKHRVYETDEYDEYVTYQTGDLIYDWDQDFGKKYNNDVVLNIGNASYSTPIQLKSVMVRVGDETCVEKEKDVNLKPRYQVRVGLLPLTSCFDITKRVRYIDAVNLASGTPEVRSDTITRDAVVSVNYIDKDGVNTQKTSTFRVSFFKTSH